MDKKGLDYYNYLFYYCFNKSGQKRFRFEYYDNLEGLYFFDKNKVILDINRTILGINKKIEEIKYVRRSI